MKKRVVLLLSICIFLLPISGQAHWITAFFKGVGKISKSVADDIFEPAVKETPHLIKNAPGLIKGLNTPKHVSDFEWVVVKNIKMSSHQYDFLRNFDHLEDHMLFREYDNYLNHIMSHESVRQNLLDHNRRFPSFVDVVCKEATRRYYLKKQIEDNLQKLTKINKDKIRSVIAQELSDSILGQFQDGWPVGIGIDFEKKHYKVSVITPCQWQLSFTVPVKGYKAAAIKQSTSYGK